jgi:hypothetical protein
MYSVNLQKKDFTQYFEYHKFLYDMIFEDRPKTLISKTNLHSYKKI